MIEKIKEVAHGKRCPKCSHDRLYQLADGRFKCVQCNIKYSAKKIENDLQILHYFSLEIPANKAAKDLGFSYPMVRNRYMQYRQEIVEILDQDFRKLSGEIECDESYFGGKKKGPRGRGSQGKMIVFGMLEKQNKIFTTVVDNVSAQTLMNEIKEHAEKGSVFYTDTFRSYKSLKQFGHHITVDHSKEFGSKRRHINGLVPIYRDWSYAKERLLKYHGVSRNHFYSYLKELEFRYNYRKVNLYQKLIEIHFSPFFL
ncbi:MAG: IS1595 family transposase [Candidatus Marinimicrobia bacterium]|nr:IS1595 family transposase [Candidatus Neomarinimicrobiota bacterium]